MFAPVEEIKSKLRTIEQIAGSTRGSVRAAVAAIMVPSTSGYESLFVKRKVDSRDPWSGQIALPGGRSEPDDKDILQTVVREVREEVDIDLAEQGRVLGALEDFAPGNVPDMTVTPFVIILQKRVSVKTSDEIEYSFWAELGKLRRELHTITLRNGRKYTGYAYFYGDHLIWGLTARILDQLLDAILENT